MKQRKKILLVGGDGYIGTALSRQLQREYDVTIYDVFVTSQTNSVSDQANKIYKDVRDIECKDLEGFDIVIDCCGISNDPTGSQFDKLTKQINQDGRIKLANLMRSSCADQFIVFSSCSVYGDNPQICHEASKISPQTRYSRSAVELENFILSNNFEPKITILRLGTLFGYSSNFRNDLVLNIFMLAAINNQIITVDGNGKQKRPFLFIEDLLNSIAKLVVAPVHQKEIFNIYSFNTSIIDLANLVSNTFGLKILHNNHNKDSRNYAISDKKLRQFYPSLTFTPVDDCLKLFNQQLQQNEYHERNTLNCYRERLKVMPEFLR